jgi:alkylation response protein AidB-like acyl-CoA dehydrogenase
VSGRRPTLDFEFSEEQEALRASVRRFLADHAPIRPYVRAQLDDSRGTTDAVWKGLADIGAVGLLVPAEHGGSGMGMVDMGVVLEEMGRVVHPGPFLSSAVAATSAVIGSGDGVDLLSALAAGSTVATLALLDGTAQKSGSSWLVSGGSSFVPDAAGADVIVVTASRGDELGLFAVEGDAPGLGIDHMPSVDGTRKHAAVILEDTPARRLGADASETVAAARDRLLTGLAVDGVGAAGAALELAVAYAKERVQFDRPIGSFQAMQHLCADMLQAVELARAGAYYALWACDAAPPAERHRAATMAKAFAGDALVRAGASAIQVFGGVGFTWEHDVHLYYKRLLTLQQAYGDSARHLEELARLVL